MPSAIDICNLALLRLGTRYTVQALDEGSAEANACNAVYSLALDRALRAHRWGFASAWATLALVDGVTHPKYAYAYAAPADMLEARSVAPPVAVPFPRTRPVPFIVTANPSRTGKLVLCDQAPATLHYTARVTDPAAFDPSFVEFLAWSVAMDVALPLTGDNAIRDRMERSFRQYVPAGTALDANEGVPEDPAEADWIADRGQGSAWGDRYPWRR